MDARTELGKRDVLKRQRVLFKVGILDTICKVFPSLSKFARIERSFQRAIHPRFVYSLDSLDQVVKDDARVCLDALGTFLGRTFLPRFANILDDQV